MLLLCLVALCTCIALVLRQFQEARLDRVDLKKLEQVMGQLDENDDGTVGAPLLRAPSWRRHSSPPWHPGGDFPGSRLCCAIGTRRWAAQGPMGGGGVAMRS